LLPAKVFPVFDGIAELDTSSLEERKARPFAYEAKPTDLIRHCHDGKFVP
jgi:hypothetical protein